MISSDSSAFQAEMVVYMGTIAALAPEPATAVMRRMVVPNSASMTVPPTAGLASVVIGCGSLSLIMPAHRSMAMPVVRPPDPAPSTAVLPPTLDASPEPPPPAPPPPAPVLPPPLVTEPPSPEPPTPGVAADPLQAAFIPTTTPKAIIRTQRTVVSYHASRDATGGARAERWRAAFGSAG